MKIISKKSHYGCRVLFVWSSIALTGVVKSIAEDSFGIICDSDIYTTDKLLIPRAGDEVFVEKEKCLKTGEIIPIRIKNGEIAKCERFPDTMTAFYHLPKYTVFQANAGFNNERLIEFIPEKHVFKFADNKYYLYTQVSPGLVTLVDVHNTLSSVPPKWKFQETIHCDNESELGMSEYDIVEVYEIPEIFSKYNVKKILEYDLLNLIYDSNSCDKMPLIHNHRTKIDTNLENLPEETFFDPNGFKK